MYKTKLLLATTMLLASLFAVTGTYAWISFSNQITSGLFGLDNGPGASLHDDVTAPNKDLYVENWGASPIFVRVMVREYMEVGDDAGARGGNKNVKKLFESADMNDESTWNIHVEGDLDNLFTKYWKWITGGQKFYQPVPESSQKSGYIAKDETVYDGSEPDIKQTQNAVTLSIADWIDIGRPVGTYWVGDTDGWYYWAAPLEAGEATGLLINEVQKQRSAGGKYYYAMQASAQFATADGDILSPGDYTSFGKAEGGGWTAEGEALMKLITGNSAVLANE
ncbi:MAG: hypothetical protein LBT59_26385 [Clostridiales bacterium]|jgi:hypothetical protein|nr:hypothetical protein [Clostridiales bacterium]